MDYRAEDGQMRRVYREEVDVLARFRSDGTLEPCVVVLRDCCTSKHFEWLLWRRWYNLHQRTR